MGSSSVDRIAGAVGHQQQQHPSALNLLNRQLPGAQLPHHNNQQHQHVVQHTHQQLSQAQQLYDQQQTQLHAEILRLRQALAEREQEVNRLNTQATKLSKVRDQEMDKVKTSLMRDRDDKLAKQSAAHNKRMVAKEEEMAALKASLLKERDKVAAWIPLWLTHYAGAPTCRTRMRRCACPGLAGGAVYHQTMPSTLTPACCV